jgi:hypothetical protein
MFNSEKWRKGYYWYWGLNGLSAPFCLIMMIVCICFPNWVRTENLFVSMTGVLVAFANAYTNFGLNSFVSSSNIAGFSNVSGPYNTPGGSALTFGVYGSGAWISSILLWVFVGLFAVVTFLIHWWYFSKHERTYTVWDKFWAGFFMPIVYLAFSVSGMSYYTSISQENLPTGAFGPTSWGWCFICGWIAGVALPATFAAFFWLLPHEGDWQWRDHKTGHSKRPHHGKKDVESGVSTTDVSTAAPSSKKQPHVDANMLGTVNF